jgi:4-amino-4-deoxy-L-arabinose transferase-like glycosyltransferase
MPTAPLARIAPILGVVCVLCVGAAFMTGLGQGFANSDEALYAEFIREMHRGGDWWVLHYQGQPVLQRPATPIALYAAVSSLAPGELGMRLAPAALMLLAALAAGLIVLLRARDWGGAVAALALVAGTPTVYLYGRLLLSDPPLVLATTLALGAAIWAWERPAGLVWLGVAAGLAVAAKSLAAAIPLAALVPVAVFALRRHGRAARPLLASALFVVAAAPFYVVGSLRYGGRFLEDHFGYNLAERARGLEGIGLDGPFAYLRHMWLADGPVVTIVLLAAVIGAAVVGRRRRDAALLIASAMAIATLVGLSLIGTRLPHYLLSFYPPAAVCAGLLVARAGIPVAALAGVLALVLVCVTSATPPFDDSAEPATETIALAPSATAAIPAGQPVYSLDFYAPALGYYADRPWRLLATTPRLATIVGGVDLFRRAGVVMTPPPWPPSPFVVAGERERLLRARSEEPRFSRAEPIASAGNLELWRVP